MASDKLQLKRRLLRCLDLPADTDGGAIRITMVNNTDLLIENHMGVIRYGTDMIRLNSAHGVIRVEGEGLEIAEFGRERAYVQGRVMGWRYEDANGCGNP